MGLFGVCLGFVTDIFVVRVVLQGLSVQGRCGGDSSKIWDCQCGASSGVGLGLVSGL